MGFDGQDSDIPQTKMLLDRNLNQFVVISVVPGMVARALYEQCKTTGQFAEWCANPDESLTDGSTADKSYPWMVVRQFPHGLKGIMMASFLAAMMSSLSSVYNSAATIFTYDVYQRFKYPEGTSLIFVLQSFVKLCSLMRKWRLENMPKNCLIGFPI